MCLRPSFLLLREPVPEGGTPRDALPCKRVPPLLEEPTPLVPTGVVGTQCSSVGVSVLDRGVSQGNRADRW